MEIKRLFDFLIEWETAQPNSPFVSSKINRVWNTYTFAETQSLSNKVSQLLINLGLQKDDKIAIISNNRPEWNFTDIGSMQIGVTAVPMYPNIAEKDYEYIFQDAGIKYAFVGDKSIYEKVAPLLEKLDTLKDIYTFDKVEGAKCWIEELPKTEDLNWNEIEKRKANVSEHDLATIIYTSGTTGNPKGVMLTHKNITSNILSIKEVAPFENNRKSLSFLPLCHSFERTVFYSYLAFGFHIYYAESLETIGENLKEVKPFCFTTVPRLLEKVYEKIMEKGNGLTGFKRKLFFWSIDLGSKYELGGGNSLWYKFQLAIARELVFKKWIEALGGEIEFIVTGAAAMQPRLIKLFSAAGINVLEGYGLSETSPVLAVNRIDEKERCIGTVGMVIPGVEIKIAEDGEILAKGDNIMKGYYNRPDLTAEVIKNGWFHTGDIGKWIEKNGNKFLKITDRKKELFKTAGGKYIAPQAIEEKMKESRFIEQIMVVGDDDKKYISALIVPSFVNLYDWAKQQEILFANKEELIRQEEVKTLFANEVNALNKNFGKWEQIKKFELLSHEWTIEGGELTPTLKLKRKAIYARYAEMIDEMYKNQHLHCES
ncbi:MAG: long-chain fatty acid--CoA ligase [Chitinophagales bacterium]|nr:long-chain fatty acid--CoA ligase [Chitinophagales bacterium]OJV29128.1 MAG: long-chain fatty acid--CoA ligase [Bacteroidetes bacterium 37-13]HRN93094.1 long-chain fatty acid--CoA ligase [Chitinophagales bacterium]HRP39824.1 long-chain fatty acid--CoA ligase [Chitinophagales bacterium]